MYPPGLWAVMMMMLMTIMMMIRHQPLPLRGLHGHLLEGQADQRTPAPWPQGEWPALLNPETCGFTDNGAIHLSSWHCKNSLMAPRGEGEMPPTQMGRPAIIWGQGVDSC